MASTSLARISLQWNDVAVVLVKLVTVEFTFLYVLVLGNLVVTGATAVSPWKTPPRHLKRENSTGTPDCRRSGGPSQSFHFHRLLGPHLRLMQFLTLKVSIRPVITALLVAFQLRIIMPAMNVKVRLRRGQRLKMPKGQPSGHQ